MSMRARLKEVDNRTKLIVQGWFRQQQNKLTIMNLAPMISAISTLYYSPTDSFDIIDYNNIILDWGTRSTIKKTGPYDCTMNNINYCLEEVGSESNSIYNWEIMIHKDQDKACRIAIVSSDMAKQENAFKSFDNFYGNGSFFMFRPGFTKSNKKRGFTHYGLAWKSGQRVMLKLDLKKYQLSISIDGISQGIAFDNIEHSKDIKYRLAISLYRLKDEIQILRFFQE